MHRKSSRSPAQSLLLYMLLPGIVPKIRALFTSGFGLIAGSMAMILGAVRLLPPDHPYLNTANQGRFGLYQVLSQGAQNLKFDRDHIDQVLVFGLLVIGLFLLFAQFALLIIAIIMQQPAFADVQIPDIGDMFKVNPNIGADQDLAFIIMDSIFGIPDLFNSCISKTSVDCVDLSGNVISSPFTYPTAYQLAFHNMLSFFSYGLFSIGAIVIVYFIISLVGETAASGTPFGKRYNKTWAFVRLMLFFALITPLPNSGEDKRQPGMNGAQMIVLMSAKLGSNFATNSWAYFNGVFTQDYQSKSETLLKMGPASSLIATPTIPELNELVKFMILVKSCKIAEQKVRQSDLPPSGIQAYAVRGLQIMPELEGENYIDISEGSSSYEKILKHANYGNIMLRFGTHYDESEDVIDRLQRAHTPYTAHVRPTCGELVIKKSSGNVETASAKMNAIYYDLIREMWSDKRITRIAQCLADPQKTSTCAPYETKFLIFQYQGRLSLMLQELIDKAKEEGDEWNIPEKTLKKGWAGAALWYNRIADLNGAVTSSIYNIPEPSRYPVVMEFVAAAKEKANQNVTPGQRFILDMAHGNNFEEVFLGDKEIAQRLSSAYATLELSGQYDRKGGSDTGNVLLDAFNWLWGSSGIFDIYRNTDVNPMAQLSSIGRGMIDATTRNLVIGGSSSALSKVTEKVPAELSKIAGGFFQGAAFLTLALGFVIYNVLPMIPFIYFFFAVVGWIKSICEALIGAPLWALSHVTSLEGEGLINTSSKDGLLLIFEILLRPILTLFGLLSSILLFSALVLGLNNTFELVVDNALAANPAHQIEELVTPLTQQDAADINGGSEELQDKVRRALNKRGAIDTFLFSAIYVLLCYMIGLSCFKMIEQVPNSILRWMGESVKGFQETAPDMNSNFIQRSYTGILQITGGISNNATLTAMLPQ